MGGFFEEQEVLSKMEHSKPLTTKLGIKECTRLLILNRPDNLGDALKLPKNSSIVSQLHEPFDMVLLFTKESKELEQVLPTLKKTLPRNGALWISWPKKASKIKSDLDENVVRRLGLKNDLVDVKVCSINDVWSGLKFVHRRKEEERLG